MAKLVGVINTAHSPFCYLSPDQWDNVRSARKPYRDDVAVEDKATQVDKAARVQRAFAELRKQLENIAPDVLIVIGDDQEELFSFANFPAIAVFVGEEFSGKTSGADRREYEKGTAPTVAESTVPGHPGLAISILTGLMRTGFDPAFMTELPNGDHGMCHAVMRPLESLTDFSIPTIPVLLNAYYAPQLTARRCYEFGRALRQLVEEYPDNLRVAVIGSGGLWHTPGQQSSWLNEEFDRQGLSYLAAGDIKGWAEAFDGYEVADGDPSQDITVKRRGITGLPSLGGPQGGTRETCNWIAAAATCEGRPSVVVDYVPIYASPVGAAFAYCTAI